MAKNNGASTAVALPKNGGTVAGGKWRRLRQSFPWLLMVFPAVLVVFLFNYLPIYGVLIAFQDFMPGDQILGPPSGSGSITLSGSLPTSSSGP